MTAQDLEKVLRFWFPESLSSDHEMLVRQFEWWFRGGADAEIFERFVPLLEQASRGELDQWAESPRGRLALIVILDQFSRTVYRGTPRAYAQDSKALDLTREGLENGHYQALETPWEKTFFFLPLGHSEELVYSELAVKIAEELVQNAPPQLHKILEHSASQARGHRDVLARFGRHPHRNEVLGRPSTPEELEYLAREQLIHTRPVPR
jgi:uncharacterized protein (DUF924 family)